jgi:Protein of unknown function (DUF1552)
MAIALPFLEFFHPSKAGAGSPVKPMRYVFAFGGTSMGLDGEQRVAPVAEGALAANLTRGLLPLGDEGVADVTSVVSGLKIPWGAAGSIPAGGRRIPFHATSTCPLACGVRTTDEDGDETLQGPTSDWIVANQIAGDTPQKVLGYRVQAAYYRGANGTGGTRGTLSARMNGGSLEQVPPISSPKVAFQSLTSIFVPPDPADAEKAKFLLERRKSVIDLVRGDTEALVPRLGAADKIRLQRHLDELRDLEKRLGATAPPTTAACVLPADPGDDPEIGGPVENGEQGTGGGYDSNAAYSNEDLRASVMVDLIHFAMACDMSRVANLMFTYAQCFMNMNPIYEGYATDLHEMSHYSMGGGEEGANAVADGVAWHVRHWAHLMRKLRDTEDFDGTSMLESTAMILCFEGGIGHDPEGPNEGAAHSTENMVVLLGGRAGGLHVTPGRHILRKDEHPVKVINTAMKAVGVEETLGEVSGTFDELFG